MWRPAAAAAAPPSLLLSEIENAARLRACASALCRPAARSAAACKADDDLLWVSHTHPPGANRPGNYTTGVVS